MPRALQSRSSPGEFPRLPHRRPVVTPPCLLARPGPLPPSGPYSGGVLACWYHPLLPFGAGARRLCRAQALDMEDSAVTKRSHPASSVRWRGALARSEGLARWIGGHRGREYLCVALINTQCFGIAAGRPILSPCQRSGARAQRRPTGRCSAFSTWTVPGPSSSRTPGRTLSWALCVWMYTCPARNMSRCYMLIRGV